jgi:imidazolonepropionase-like amidohydrolase
MRHSSIHRLARLASAIAIAGCALASAPALLGCDHASPPPAVAPVSPKDYPRPIVPPPPWQARLSVAEGYEQSPPPGRPVLIRGATLMLATGKSIQRGSILLEKGKIAAISEGDVAAPSDAIVVDGAGKFVTPGLIDSHSHMGVYPMPGAMAHEDGNEMTDPVTPQAQTADAFWTQDPGLERAVAGGVTTIQVLPGSGNLIGGRATTVKLRRGISSREVHVRGAPDGLKMACGENPKRVYGANKRAPMTRMGNLAIQRAAFLKAQKLQQEWARWREAESRRISGDMKKRAEFDAKREERKQRQAWCREDPSREACGQWASEWRRAPLSEPEPTEPVKQPDRDPGLETLIAAMEGRVLVHIHCYRADDMLAMLALADEMGFRVRSFHHALEAYKIRRELAARGVATSTWADWWGFKLEAYDGIPENAALIHESGGRPVIHSDSSEGVQRLNQEAAKALASGKGAGISVTEEDAIKWITIYPAWALGIDHRTGSLEVGKDADVVLWTKDPFSVYASASMVWIDGELTLDRGSKAPPWSDFELGQDGATRGTSAPDAAQGGAR